MITQDELKEIWEYLPDTDSFKWKSTANSRNRKVGDLVTVTSRERIRIFKTDYNYTKLKQLYLTGEYPSNVETVLLGAGNITWDTLVKVIRYDYDTGLFYWNENRGPAARKGDMAGSLENTGYISIRIGRKAYLAHRLAWFYCFKEWPEKYIDHIDRDKTNNSLDNLRELDPVWNSRNRGLNKNNSSGHVGVYFSKEKKKYVAEIIINKVKHRLGYYDTAEDAGSAYKNFESMHTYENITIG